MSTVEAMMHGHLELLFQQHLCRLNLRQTSLFMSCDEIEWLWCRIVSAQWKP